MAFETRHFIRSRILVNVDLFNRDRMNLTVEKTWTIADIYTEVCDYLGIPESKLFGLARQSGKAVLVFWFSDCGFVFLDPEMRISSLCRKPTVRHMVCFHTQLTCSAFIFSVLIFVTRFFLSYKLNLSSNLFCSFLCESRASFSPTTSISIHYPRLLLSQTAKKMSY